MSYTEILKGLRLVRSPVSKLFLTCFSFVLLGSAVTAISLTGQVSMANLFYLCFWGWFCCLFVFFHDIAVVYINNSKKQLLYVE